MASEELLKKRIAFIRRIVGQQQDTGKTKIQKITYFLQEAIGVSLMYPFRMHYYGPYSDDLDDVLSLTQSLGYIEIRPDPDGFGYHVTSCEPEQSSSFGEYDISEEEDAEQVDSAIDVLGGLETYELELYATIHYVGGSSSRRSRDETLKIVRKLKPRFTAEAVDGAYSTLKEAGLI